VLYSVKIFFFAVVAFLLSPLLLFTKTEAQTLPRNELQEKIVAIGDSITVGWPTCTGVTSEGCSCEGCYVPRLSVLSGMPAVNEGKNLDGMGAGSGYGAAHIDDYLEAHKPRTLTIYYGNNEPANVAYEVVIANLRYIVDRCLAYGTKPVIATLGPQFYDFSWRQPYIRQINQGIRQLAASRGIPLADLAAALWDKPYLFEKDGIHPTIAGHAVIADVFFRAINRCAYAVSPLIEYFKHSGGTGSVSVTTGTGSLCSWTAVSHVDWIVVMEASGGAGSGTVSYRVAYNNTGRERTGALTIAGETFTLSQKKVPSLNFLNLLLDE